MGDTQTQVEVPVSGLDIRVSVDDDGEGVVIFGVDADASAFLLAVQRDDLRAVRWEYRERPEVFRGGPSLGEEIANRVAQVVRKAVESRILVYRGEEWGANLVGARQALFGASGR